MRKIPLQWRLIINITIFTLPLLVMTILMFKSESVNIDFSAKEREGSALQAKYENVWRQLSYLHLHLAQDLSPASISDLEQEYEKQKDLLQFSDAELAKRNRGEASLEVLKTALAAKDWPRAIGSVKLAITHLGDTSNLILDPDLDSYYMMDIVLLAAPQMQDRLTNVLAGINSLYEGPELDRRIQAALYASQLEEADLNRIVADSHTSLNEDTNFYGTSPTLQARLPNGVEQLSKVLKLHIEQLKTLANGGAIAKEDLAQSGIKALNESFSFWDMANEELAKLIDIRLVQLKSSRTSSMIYAGVALLFAILLSIYIGSTISESLTTILRSITQLQETAAASKGVSSLLSSVSQNVFQKMTQTSAAVEETAASIEEINSMLKVNTDNSEEASSLAQKADSVAATGQTEILAVLNSMSDIAQSSKQIVDTVTVIDDIAFQTNLLALNASVEAARAGEQGKGFAVVAEAVRTLALKSANSAKDINSLLKSNVELVTKSHQKAAQAVANLNEIVGSIKRVSVLNVEIAAATKEQAVGLSQISRAVGEFEISSSDNQKSMDQVSGASEDLHVQVQLLDETITNLEREVRGNSTSQKRKKTA